jgi:tetratricopeptide (TPR) repeat protein
MLSILRNARSALLRNARSVLADRQKLIAGAALLAGICLLGIRLQKLWFYTDDNAYVLARYARNLASGDGLLYNAGEVGWASPSTLLPVLLAPLDALGIDPVSGAKWIGVLSLVAISIALAWAIARHAPGWLAAAGLLPIVAFGPMMLQAVAGVETALFAALTLAALLAAVRERHRDPVRIPLSVLLLLLAVLARFDALLYAPAVLLAGWNGELRRSLRFALVFAGGVLLLWIAHAAYYGEWLPSPAYSSLGALGARRSGSLALSEIAANYEPLVLAIAIATVLACVGNRDRRRDALGFVAAAATCFASAGLLRGDPFLAYPYIAPVVLFAAPLLIWSLSAAAELTGSASRRVRPGYLASGLGAVLLLASLSTYRSDPAFMPRLHLLRTESDLLVAMGVAANKSDPALTYALSGIGGFGWGSSARVLDLEEPVPGLRAPVGEPSLSPSIERARPDVIIVMAEGMASPNAGVRHNAAIVQLDRGPLPAKTLDGLLGQVKARADQAAAAYIKREKNFRLINIATVSGADRIYLIAARDAAVARLPETLRGVRFNNGVAHYVAGDRARGLEMVQRELQGNRYDEMGRLHQSRRLLTAKRPTDARKLLEELVALAPYNADAWNNLGFALGVEGRFREAVVPLERALRLTPDYQLARNNLGWVRSKLR